MRLIEHFQHIIKGVKPMDFATRAKTDYFVVHCSATRPVNRITVDILRQWHIARGFSDIGYHYFIDFDGAIHKGREPDDCIGAHVQGHNANTLGICLEGGLNNSTGAPDNTFTSKQFQALIGLVHLLLPKFPNGKILGHRDFSPDLNHDGIVEANEFMKACPCFDAIEWAKANNLPFANLYREKV
jgi:N-acetylmuramoyl-L-alanine amidase